PASAEVLHTHRSAPLKDLLRESIATSNAFDHEMYAVAAAAAQSPDGRASLTQASKRTVAFLEQQLAVKGLRMDNASGLGDADRLASANVVALLSNAAEHPRYAPLLQGLARPGHTGTLLTRMLDTPAERRLHAKTGTLGNAVALSGTVDRALAFS